MNSSLPESSSCVVVGAGAHVLGTARHLAVELEERGAGSGAGIVLPDKTGPGAGTTDGVWTYDLVKPVLTHAAPRRQAGIRSHIVFVGSRRRRRAVYIPDASKCDP